MSVPRGFCCCAATAAAWRLHKHLQFIYSLLTLLYFEHTHASAGLSCFLYLAANCLPVSLTLAHTSTAHTRERERWGWRATLSASKSSSIHYSALYDFCALSEHEICVFKFADVFCFNLPPHWHQHTRANRFIPGWMLCSLSFWQLTSINGASVSGPLVVLAFDGILLLLLAHPTTCTTISLIE